MVQTQEEQESRLLMKLDNLCEGSIIKRPSKLVRSPYVADINIDNNVSLAHTASLGCCGLADAGATVLIQPIIPKKKEEDDSKKCKYRVYLSVISNGEHETIIGIYPKIAETLVEKAINYNFLSNLQNIKSYKRETCVFIKDKVDSRFDFSGVDENNVPFLLEVKNVPLADYEDMTSSERKKHDFSDRDFNSKVAYFPDGYRKKTTDPVSPRALKHIRELATIKKECNTRCILCFVIQRTDVNRFTTSIIDPEYKQAVKDAAEDGVEIIAIVVKWTRDGNAYFVRDDLPISL